MPLRMLRYYTDIRLAGHNEPLRQFLLYIGADPLTMPGGIDTPKPTVSSVDLEGLMGDVGGAAQHALLLRRSAQVEAGGARRMRPIWGRGGCHCAPKRFGDRASSENVSA